MPCAQKANVPCVPGSKGLIKDDEDCLKVVGEIGLPVMIKATAGEGAAQRGAHTKCAWPLVPIGLCGRRRGRAAPGMTM